MPRRDRREFHPFVTVLDGQEYEIHPDGKVYHRRPRQRLRCLNKLTETFRTEEATLRRVKDPALVSAVQGKAKGVSWTQNVAV
ncbi:MAG TPA: hypothetical protein VLH81_11545 [Desulfobacterales bacterium]|nr:hypothetical protein [Desulfobacterales bacterium]